MAIGTLAYKITADTRSFDRSIKATRREMSSAKRLIEATRTPVEKLEQAERGLQQLYQKRVIDLKTYSRSLARVRAELAPTTAAVDKKKLALADMGGALGVNIGALSAWSLGLAAAGAAAMAAKNSIGDLRRTLADMDSQLKTARTVGVEVNQLRALELGASRAGISNIEPMLKRLSRVTGDTVNDMGEAAAGFDALGIDIQKFVQLPVEKRFQEIAVAIGELATREQQVSVAAKIFESEGRDLVRLFDDIRSAGGVEYFRDEIDRLGLSIDSVDAARLQDFSDTLDNFAKRKQGVKESFLVGLVGEVNALAEALDRAGTGFTELLSLTAKAAGGAMANIAIDTVVGQAAGTAIRAAGKAIAVAAPKKTAAVPGRLAAKTPGAGVPVPDEISPGLQQFLAETKRMRDAAPDPFQQAVRRSLAAADTVDGEPFQSLRQQAPTANTAVMKGSAAAVSLEARLRGGRSKELGFLSRIEKNTRRISADTTAADQEIIEVGI